MTNLDIVTSVLAAHREARRWADADVAVDVLARLGLDPMGGANDEPVAAEPATPAGVAPWLLEPAAEQHDEAPAAESASDPTPR